MRAGPGEATPPGLRAHGRAEDSSAPAAFTTTKSPRSRPIPGVPGSLPREVAQAERRLVPGRAFPHTRFVKAGLSRHQGPAGPATIPAASAADTASDGS
jgi:hypothetical protein